MSKSIKWGAGLVCSVALVIGIVQQHHPELRISQQGLDLIGNAEGCRQDPYRCPADVLTVGIGSTAALTPINPHKVYRLEEIAERWAADLKSAEQCVNHYANGKMLSQGEFDALTSITFNVGCEKLKNSTLFKLARQNKPSPMCQELTKWVYANGKKLKGLVVRREKEKRLCEQR